MARRLCRTGVFALATWLTASGFAQTSNRLNVNLNRMAVNTKDDMSQMKLLAERGFVDAQIKVAKACMASRLFADSLKWYTAAANQGVVEANYERGHILLFGCDGTSPEQIVKPKPEEGLKATYYAATNRCLPACLDMARALRDGIGCHADPVSAYVWYAYCADNGNESSRTAMNELALRLSTEDIRQAIARSRELKAGRWPEFTALTSAAPAEHKVAPVDIQLKLGGIIYSPRGNLAVINKHTLGEGETSEFTAANKASVAVTCVHIEKNIVQVQVRGEAEPRYLVGID